MSPEMSPEMSRAQRIVVIGGGAAGIGAAGAAKAVDAAADIRVYTEFEDVGYSPCGIPYVHGKEIPDFERLFLATKEAYARASTSTMRHGPPDSTRSGRSCPWRARPRSATTS
jgi:hypothetical protein